MDRQSVLSIPLHHMFAAYDGDGRRVSKSSDKLYWYGAGSEILAETDAFGNALTEYIFFGGKRIARLANAIQNGGFENGFQGWTDCCGGSTVVNNPANAHSGNSYMQLSTSTFAGVNAALIPVQPGNQITFGGWVYVQSGSAGAIGWWLAV